MIEEKNYIVKWKSFDKLTYKEENKVVTFSDIQWKSYGIRTTNDETEETFVIPYTSIYDIEIIKI